MGGMASQMEGTGVMIAGVGGGVPAVGSAPHSLFAGVGVLFLALVSPWSGSGVAGQPRGVVGLQSLCGARRPLVAEVVAGITRVWVVEFRLGSSRRP